MQDLRTRTLSGLGWSGIAQVARQILQFSIGVILARLLTPEDFGLIGMIIVFSGFALIFGDLGFGAALIQKTNVQQHHLSSVFWVNVATGIVLTGVVAASAPLIASFYDEPALRLLTMAIALNFFFGSFKVVQNALLQKDINFRRFAQIETVAIFSAGLLALIGALIGFGVWALVVQSIVYTFASVLILWIVSPWRPTLSLNINAIKELLSFSSNLLGFNILNYFTRNLDNLLIAKFIGAAALGIYTRAYSLMLLPVTEISSVVSRVMFPSLSIIQNDIDTIKTVYLRATRTIALVTFPMMIGLLVIAKPFILTVYGSKWHDVTPILQIFCLTGMQQSVGTTVGWIFTSQGRTDLMFKLAIFFGFVRGVSFVIGLQWGVIGVAAAYALSGYVILWYPIWRLSGRLINLRFKEMIMNLSAPFYCATAMGIALWPIGLALPTDWPNWAFLAVQVPIGIILYVTLAKTFKIRAYFEAGEIIKEVWKQRKFKDVGLELG